MNRKKNNSNDKRKDLEKKKESKRNLKKKNEKNDKEDEKGVNNTIMRLSQPKNDKEDEKEENNSIMRLSQSKNDKEDEKEDYSEEEIIKDLQSKKNLEEEEEKLKTSLILSNQEIETNEENQKTNTTNKEPTERIFTKRIRILFYSTPFIIKISFFIFLSFGCIFLYPVFFDANATVKRIKDVFPYPSTLYKILETLSDLDNSYNTFTAQFGTPSKSPGEVLAEKGARAHSPIIIIPGIISTTLELWKGLEGSDSHFRKKIWGSFDMLKFILSDKKSWCDHMRLENGLDPKGIKVRASQGLGASDFLLPGYWIWSKIIQNLAEVGYDYTNLHLSSFDWRLGMEELEKRDFFFTKLKNEIEFFRKTSGKKVVLLSHSLGTLVCYYFMKWVENSCDFCDQKSETEKNNSKNSDQKCKCNKNWVSENIESILSIAAPFLGSTKAISGMLSGEGKDTAHSGFIESNILDFFLGKEERRELFRGWGSIHSLMPKGGRRFWRNKNVIKIRNGESFDVENVNNVLQQTLNTETYNRINKCHRGNYKDNKNQFNKKENWTNPLLNTLPNAPDLTIYSFYGVGKMSEEGYIYDEIKETKIWEKIEQYFYTSTDNETEIQILNEIMIKEESKDKRYFEISKDVNNSNKNICRGIYMTNGDGTVPLVSLGYMGRKGWRNSILNPYNVKTVVREYEHNPISILKDVRGGPDSSDHVDILGNYNMTIDLIKVVCKYEELQDCIVSELDEVCEKIDETN
ncbi:phospholipid:diacylglycerol acyltransferase [Hamiltosporidium tvaerminnensis]|uniref:Phospholipid:diacylglycerol acyltransferase n=1 Tax=Hamiltosporidium tvaerminnensis TaxID=1176355 RepID=A0A4Q9KU12_9MICR|nr:phospholipid:diacylglycerol acyltransferase [Hamiltosporidium tvaerminnensis]